MNRPFIKRILREENGIVLVLSLAAMMVLAIATTGVLIAGTTNENTTYFSLRERSAFAVAQQSLAYGEGMVYADVEASPSVTPPISTWENLPAQPSGSGQYKACPVSGTGSTSCLGSGNTWYVTGTGTLGGVTRTVSAYVTPTVTGSTALWQNIYVDSTSQCATFGGNAQVAWPILTRGDLCLQGSSTIFSNTIEVGGSLTLTGGPHIGTAGSPVPKLEVVGSCDGDPPGALLSASTSNCLYGHNNIYYSGCPSACNAGHVLDSTPQMPTVNFQAAYNAQAALTKSGCPNGLFDGDATMNNSVSSVDTIMFGNSNYTCTVKNGSTTVGSIAWNHTTNALTVSGTLYFDGSLTIKGINVTYTGKASLYFSGGVSMKQSQLCDPAGCANWNTANNLIVIVAGCQGGASGCVTIGSQATADVAAYVNGEYDTTSGGTNYGPVECLTINLQGGGTSVLPILGSFPVGTPTTSITGTPPTGWSG